MLDQTFSIIDIPRLLTLVFLECILSIDNALVLALIVRPLHPVKRKKALFIGLSSSIVLRAIGVLSAAFLIRLFWVQILGGIYLLYLAASHLFPFLKFKRKGAKKAKRAFWKTVALIEWTDFIFAVDSILAGIAMIGVVFHPPHLPPKIWIVYAGGLAGIILMRFAARLLSATIDKFPRIEMSAHLIIGWIGLKLLLEASLKMIYKSAYQGLSFGEEAIFWGGMLFLFFLGFLIKQRKESSL